MSFVQRTHLSGKLRTEHLNTTVTLNGWAHKVRDLGGLVFIDLRDRTGIVQLVLDPEVFGGRLDIRTESCLSVTGEVQMRSEATRNPKMPTGDLEVSVSSFSVLNASTTLPFPISDESQMSQVNEELRVKYRYLDLRRPAMYKKLALRAAAIRKIRSFLDSHEFVEIETPIITKSTPEGARDYLVPYRLDPGKFYALPQSPQQYKQLLMVAGVERYYQIAKCFRDEAQRADRQPEFTQLDLEMSFITQDQILELMEEMTVNVVNQLIAEFDLPKDPIKAFPRLTYDDAIREYGSDKPDLRFGLPLFEITDLVRESGFAVFRNTAEGGGIIRGVRYPTGAGLSRKEISQLEDFCKEHGAKGMASISVLSSDSTDEAAVTLPDGRKVKSSIVKFLQPEEIVAILDRAKAEPLDLLCFIADSPDTAHDVAGRLRLKVGDALKLRDPRKLAFAYVLDFPLVHWNAGDQRWDPSHHPFTSPKYDDLVFIDSDPGRMRADCYDLVCNGVEWASGSIRIHDPEIQKRVFKLIGIGEEEQEERFGHILQAFKMGAPPHGGIAPGIDRLIMFLTDDSNIREVIAFPKMGNGYDPMMDAPSIVDPQQWAELGLRLSE